jgi:hypothetical protein
VDFSFILVRLTPKCNPLLFLEGTVRASAAAAFYDTLGLGGIGQGGGAFAFTWFC